MSIFTAIEAKQLRTFGNREYATVVQGIKKEAQKGKDVLHIYSPLKPETLEKLRQGGFSILPSSSIAVQRDGLYYTIMW